MKTVLYCAKVNNIFGRNKDLILKDNFLQGYL